MNLMSETNEKYRAFRESLQATIASMEKDMENVAEMSKHAELYDQLEENVVKLQVNIENAALKPEDIARRFEEFQETASFLRQVEVNLSKLVLTQKERTRAKTESAIEIARKIAGSD